MEASIVNVRDKIVVGVGYALDEQLLRLHARGARAVEARFRPENLSATAHESTTFLEIEEHGVGLADVVICSFALSYVTDLNQFAESLSELSVPGADLFLVDIHPETDRLGWRKPLAPEGLPEDLPIKVHDLPGIRQRFDGAGFELESLMEPRLGHPEKRLFESVVRPDLFDQVRHMPALYLFHFRRRLLSSDRLKGIGFRRPRPRACHLVGAHVALGPHTSVKADIVLDPERIRGIYEKPTQSHAQRSDDDVIVDLSGYMLLPGMINAHDHLGWGINLRNDPPHEATVWMGALKNVMSGVTTVLHHEPEDAALFSEGFPIRVVRNYGWANSLDPAEVVPHYAATAPDAPFVIHVQGYDPEDTRRKFTELQQVGVINDRTVVVHGGSLDQQTIDLLHRSGASQVWCPSSLMNGDSLVDPAFVVSNHRVCLGTATSEERSLDIFAEIQNALSLGVPPEAIYSMVTSRPCSILRLKNGEGRIVAGTPADILAVPHEGGTPAETLCAADAHSLDAVFLAGRPIVMTDEMAERGPEEWRRGMESIRFDGTQCWVRWQLQRLIRNLVDRAGSPHLSGKTLTV
jgi:cytosine/adenosine deaminase-related metal-dependent hydrolase